MGEFCANRTFFHFLPFSYFFLAEITSTSHSRTLMALHSGHECVKLIYFISFCYTYVSHTVLGMRVGLEAYFESIKREA